MACSIREAIKIVQKIRGIHIDVEKVYDLDEFWLICVDRSYRFDPNDILSGGAGGEPNWVVYKDSGKCEIYDPPRFYDVAIQFYSDNPPKPIDKSLWSD